ncbi:glycine zipper 2TM domain-containing protein [Stenotrophomonas indicatrix]|uniref:glycine zipper 2TM domain-containing protein n=1 Tax=Stenotrophomonas indicatrix TaxID=2045451 RepID=UPI0028AA795D|nr:glycine zipper 2TM domain-containing protein [Stenotrophomonas indicatrix]
MLSTSALSFRGLAMALALLAGVAVVSDASAMSRKDKRTVVGAVVGGVAGHLISNGDPAATVGGAVAGGAIGNLTTPDRHDRRYDGRYDRRYDRGYDRRYDRGYNRGYGYDRRDDRRWQRERHDNRYYHDRGRHRGW